MNKTPISRLQKSLARYIKLIYDSLEEQNLSEEEREKLSIKLQQFIDNLKKRKR